MLDLNLEGWLGAGQGRKVWYMRDFFSLWCLLKD